MQPHEYPPHIVSAVKAKVLHLAERLDMKIKKVGGGYIRLTDYDSLVDELVHVLLLFASWPETVCFNDIDGLDEGTVLQDSIGRVLQVNESNKKAIKDVFSEPYKVIYWPPKFGDRLSEKVIRKIEGLIKRSRIWDRFADIIYRAYSMFDNEYYYAKLRDSDISVSLLATFTAWAVHDQSVVKNVELVKRLHPSAILLRNSGEVRYSHNYIDSPQGGDYPALVLHWG